MTAHLFNCSACGAPLIPKGSRSIISCPYCRASVVVPEELRPVSEAAAWSLLLFDGFTSNDHNWLVGSLPSNYFSKLNQSIAEGRYRWEAHVSLPSSITTSWLRGYPVSDFHLVVNCKHIRGSHAGSSCGLIFRIRDNHNYYWFRVTDNKFFAISVVQESEWLTLVDWTRTETIKPNGVNQLEVIAYQTHFSFLINGQLVSEVEADHFSQGFVGVAIEGYTSGEDIMFDFMDISLRAP